MYIRPLAPIALFLAGVALIALAVVTGDADVTLVVIFPVFSGTSGTFLLGIVLIIMSFVVGFAMLALGQIELQRATMLGTAYEPPARVEAHTEKKYGGVVLLGPVPIAFGSDRKIALAMLVLGIVLAIVLLGLLVALL